MKKSGDNFLRSEMMSVGFSGWKTGRPAATANFLIRGSVKTLLRPAGRAGPQTTAAGGRLVLISFSKTMAAKLGEPKKMYFMIIFNY